MLAARKVVSLFLALTMAASLAACSTKPMETKNTTDKKEETSNTPVDGGKLVIADIGDPESLNPIYINDNSGSTVSGWIHHGLTQINHKLEVVPQLAEKWDVTNGGKTYTYTLRKGVKWHDGQPFTAKDVAFTFNAIMHPLYGGTRQSNFDKLIGFKEAKAKYDAIKKDQKENKIDTATADSEFGKAWQEFKAAGGVKLVDDYTIQFNIVEPFAPFLTYLGMDIIPEHILKDVRPDKMKEHETNRKPIGTGPYKIVDWKKGDQIILEANPDFYGGKVHISQLVYKIIPDQNAIAVALEDGSVDFGVITPELFDRFKGRDGLKVYEYQQLSYTYMGYNLTNDLFKDVKVRQALTHALDRKGMVDAILMGHGSLANTHGAPTRWDYNPSTPAFDFNQAKAKQMLDDAGWKVGPDGIRVKDGKRFKFTIQTNQNKVREQVVTIIQQQLKEVGVEVETKVVEWSSFVSKSLLGQEFDVLVVGWALGADPDAYTLFHSSQTAKGMFNFVHYVNKDVDALIEKGRITPDQNQRKQIYGEMQKLIAEDQPYTFLFFPNAIEVLRDKFKGPIEAGAAGLTNNVHEWWIPKDKQ